MLVSSEELDAYSRTVSAVAQLLTPHVASVSLRRGGGSAVVCTDAGHLLTNAHVVGGDKRGTATFSKAAPRGEHAVPEVTAAPFPAEEFPVAPLPLSAEAA